MEAGRREVTSRPGGVGEVFLAALRLGLTSFGGPTAHIGFFRAEYVERRRWLDEQEFGELVAVATLLPGPSSSQVGMAIGGVRAGWPGAIASWVGFTLPSAVLMLVFALGVRQLDVVDAGWLRGLGLAAAAVVAWAVIGMARTLTPDLVRVAVAVLAAAVAIGVPGSVGQVLVIIGAAAFGAIVLASGEAPSLTLPIRVPRVVAVGALVLLVGLLVLLPIARESGHAVAMFEAFFGTGALVFGGGHVVLPLLDAAVVEPGWVSEETFVAGYGAAQALPGPLFTFSAYLGAVQEPEPNGVPGGLLALFAIFLPSFLLLLAVLPAWSRVRAHSRVRSALAGVGAGVVGLLAAAFWNPVLTSSVDGVLTAGIAIALFCALRFVPPWVVVAVGAGVGALVL